MTPLANNSNGPEKATPDAVETVERVVRRAQLVPRKGDVLLYRNPAGIKRPEMSWLYRYQVVGTDLTSVVFATYEHAVTQAEHLAADRRVRLFYAESKDGKAQLLKEGR